MRQHKELAINFDERNGQSYVEAETSSFPVIFDFKEGLDNQHFINWYKGNNAQLDNLLLMAGAILFRGTGLKNAQQFEEVLNGISSKFMPYIDGFSPRTKLSNSVYTSTEYDQDFYITPHNELSFSYKWPSKLYFCCIIPAEEGGETPIGDCRKILKKLNPTIVQEMEEKGVRYIRNLHGAGGVGPSWQETFETEDKKQVEEYCRSNHTVFEWNENGGLKVIQTRKAVISHPVTHERIWFNQIDQFHPSQFDPEIYETLKMMYTNDEALPMFGTYGDGSGISVETIKEIRTTVDDNLTLFSWRQGDLLLIDNMLVCHGRMPYKGDRKILVSMTE